MITDPSTIPNCVIWLDGADVSTLGPAPTGPGVVNDGSLIQYWENKVDPAKSFTQNSNLTSPTYYQSLSAINLESQYTDPYLAYIATPGNEFVYNKEQTTIVLGSFTKQRHTTGHKYIFQQIDTVGTLSTKIYAPLLITTTSTGWDGTSYEYGHHAFGSGLNRTDNYAYYNLGARGYNVHQGIDEASMLVSRLADNSLINYNGLSKTDTVSSDCTLLNFFELGGSPVGTLSAAETRIGQYVGAVYEVLVYDRALTFNELKDINYYFYRKWTPAGLKILRDVYPVASGNWSNPAIWSINTEPAGWNTIVPTDYIYTDGGHVVDIDVDAHVEAIINKDLHSLFWIASGDNGRFNITNGVSLTADFDNRSVENYYVTMSPAATATITGSFYTEGYHTEADLWVKELSGLVIATNADNAGIPRLRNRLLAEKLININNNIDRVEVNQTYVLRSNVWTLSAGSNSSLTINGNITCLPRRVRYKGYAGQGYKAINWASNAPLNINGDVLFESYVWWSGLYALPIVNYGHLNVVGNVRLAGIVGYSRGSYVQGITNYSTGTLSITGNVNEGLSTGGWGVINYGGTVHLNGNAECVTGSGYYSGTIYNSNNGKLYIKGDVKGPQINGLEAAYSVRCVNDSYTSIVGNVYGGVGAIDAGGIWVENTASVVISGDLIPNYNPAIYSTSTTPLSVFLVNDGINYSTGEYSVCSIVARSKYIKESDILSKKFTRFTSSTNTPIYYWSSALAGTFTFPATNNVRTGLVYGTPSTTGTMDVPPVTAVTIDCPIDENNVTITNLIPGRRYEIVELDSFYSFKNVGADANAIGVSFVATNPAPYGTAVAKTVGTAVINSMELLDEDLDNLTIGSNTNPTLGTALRNLVLTESVSAIAKGFN